MVSPEASIGQARSFHSGATSFDPSDCYSHGKGLGFLFFRVQIRPYATARCPRCVLEKFIFAIGYWFFIREVLDRFPIYGDEAIFRSACH